MPLSSQSLRPPEPEPERGPEEGPEGEGIETTAALASKIGTCSRCGGDHDEIVWSVFTRPVQVSDNPDEALTHWAVCPATGEPILMRIKERKESA